MLVNNILHDSSLHDPWYSKPPYILHSEFWFLDHGRAGKYIKIKLWVSLSHDENYDIDFIKFGGMWMNSVRGKEVNWVTLVSNSNAISVIGKYQLDGQLGPICNLL